MHPIVKTVNSKWWIVSCYLRPISIPNSEHHDQYQIDIESSPFTLCLLILMKSIGDWSIARVVRFPKPLCTYQVSGVGGGEPNSALELQLQLVTSNFSKLVDCSLLPLGTCWLSRQNIFRILGRGWDFGQNIFKIRGKGWDFGQNPSRILNSLIHTRFPSVKRYLSELDWKVGESTDI